MNVTDSNMNELSSCCNHRIGSHDPKGRCHSYQCRCGRTRVAKVKRSIKSYLATAHYIFLRVIESMAGYGCIIFLLGLLGPKALICAALLPVSILLCWVSGNLKRSLVAKTNAHH